MHGRSNFWRAYDEIIDRVSDCTPSDVSTIRPEEPVAIARSGDADPGDCIRHGEARSARCAELQSRDSRHAVSKRLRHSLMLYTSGTTAKPKGVPRRHRTERAAAIAHVARNPMQPANCTLGVMPLYHTMAVRSLLAMSLINGSCLLAALPRSARA